RLRLHGVGPVRFLAWAPGFSVTTHAGMIGEPTQIELETKSQGVIQHPAEVAESSLSFIIRERLTGAGIPGCVLFIDGPENQRSVAISDQDGLAEFVGVPQSTGVPRIYAPGMLPTPNWELPAIIDGNVAHVRTAQIVLDGLQPGDFSVGKRIDTPSGDAQAGTMPLQRANAQGQVLFQFLPLGRYEFSVQGSKQKPVIWNAVEGSQVVALSTGLNQ
ncbi:MAG: hypothetical protein MK213_04635, partial [Planctomycetes bacterium]|nr:hypothetical protein [Planctomycetota bacterium]